MNLFEGEIFNEKATASNEIPKCDSDVNQKYLSGEVRIVTEQARYPLISISNLFKDSINYNVHPDFQRRRRWSNEKKSKLIESFIINVPVPPVFLYEIDYAKFEVMDGLQRITTIIDFYDDKFELKDLDEWPELNGRKYSQLPEKIKEGIDRRYLSSIILLKESAKSDGQADTMKKLVFERLNSGGVQLSSQEARNALYDGKLNRLCLKLSNNAEFKQLWGIAQANLQMSFFDCTVDISDDEEIIDSKKIKDLYDSMGDVELILRFFAFRHLDNFKGNILENFLDQFLQVGNSYSDSILGEYKKLFESTISLASELFGDKAFKQYNDNLKWSTISSKTSYDPLMQVLSKYYKKQYKLEFNKGARVQKLQDLFVANREALNGKRQNKSDIIKRIAVYEKLVDSLVACEGK